jgi:transcriptional regulator with XRE-family HTH domain
MTLRKLLSYRGKTQSQLAAALGVSQAMVSKWVRGKRNPKWQTAARIAGALGAVVHASVPRQGGEWNYTPVEDSPAQEMTQEEANDELSYIDDAE